MKTAAKTALGAAAALSLLLTGCSSDEDTTGPSSGESQTGTAAEGSGEATGTVTIKHAWGEDEYPVNPGTVVAMGAAVDDLLALGITPDVVVGAARDAEAPWRAGKLDDADFIEVANFKEIPVEDIANAEPELIVGDFWSVSQEAYTSLKDIAPTLGGIGTSAEERGWRPRIEALGKIFNKEDAAAQVIADHDQLFADTAEELPGLAGKSGLVAQFAKERGGIGVVIDPEEPGNSFLKELGMTLPEGFADLEDNGSGRAMVSAETISAMDGDFGVIYAISGTEADIHAIPGFDDLRQVRAGTMVFGDETLVQALNNPSALSLNWALDQLRDTLEKVADL